MDIDGAMPRKLQLWRFATALEPDLHAVAALLRTIPDVAAAVIRYANSAYLGRFYPVGTILDASVRIGCRAVGALAMATVSREVLDSYGNDEDWERALIVGRAARLIAEISGLGREPSEQLFVAGLFSGLGTAALEVRDSGYRDWRRRQRARGTRAPELLRRERMVYGVDHATAAGRLLEEWNLPTPLVAAVANHHQGNLEGFDKILIAAMTIVYGAGAPDGCLDVSFTEALGALGLAQYEELIRREAALFAESAAAAIREDSVAEVSELDA